MGEALTVKQSRAARIIAAGNYESKTDLARKAGYSDVSPSSLSIAGDRLLTNAKVTQAAARRKKGVRDSVSSNLKRSVELTSTMLETCEDIPTLALVSKASADILERLPEDAPTASQGHELWALIAAAYSAGRRHERENKPSLGLDGCLLRRGIATREHPVGAAGLDDRPAAQNSGDIEIAPSAEISGDLEIASLSQDSGDPGSEEMFHVEQSTVDKPEESE